MIEDKILQKVESLRYDLIDAVQVLVRIQSVKETKAPGAPFGRGITAALKKALEISAGMGFATRNLDGMIGYAQYGQGDSYVAAMGHVDVVTAGEGWQGNAFTPKIQDGKLYGRGALDNKGPLMGCLYGLYALKLLGIQPKRPIRIIFGCDEESGFSDCAYYLTKETPPVYGFTPDCKYPVVYAERGRATIRLDQAAGKLNDFLAFVNSYFLGQDYKGTALGIAYENPEYGVMELRNYRLLEDSGIVSLQFDASYPAGISIETILGRIREKADPREIRTTLIRHYKPVRFEKDGVLVKTLQECYEQVTGFDGTPVTTTGGTYAKVMPGIVPFGPSFPGQKGIAHLPGEWIGIEDLMLNAKIYALSLYRLSFLD